MPSIGDCALLAQDIYDRTGGSSAADAGWSRRDPMNWGNGFAAGTYVKGTEVVVAFRGTETDDAEDLISDAMMVPLTQRGQAQSTLRSLLREYNVTSLNLITAYAPSILEGLMQQPVMRAVIRSRANQVPGEQLHAALQYFGRSSPAPTMVTGHSLGGALAQLVSLQRGVRCVAFNSPHMGDLGASSTARGATVAGAVPMSSQLLVQVNADRDPLSMATRGINTTHGREIIVPLPTYHAPPSRRSAEAPWLVQLIAPIPSFFYRELNYNRELLAYMGDIMLDGHSMANLCTAVRALGRFSNPLRPDMSNA